MLCACKCVQEWSWRPKLGGSVFFSQHMISRYWTQFSRLDNRWFHLLNHLISLNFCSKRKFQMFQKMHFSLSSFHMAIYSPFFLTWWVEILLSMNVRPLHPLSWCKFSYFCFGMISSLFYILPTASTLRTVFLAVR